MLNDSTHNFLNSRNYFSDSLRSGFLNFSPGNQKSLTICSAPDSEVGFIFSILISVKKFSRLTLPFQLNVRIFRANHRGNMKR